MPSPLKKTFQFPAEKQIKTQEKTDWMLRRLPAVCLLVLIFASTVATAQQQDSTNPAATDPALLAIATAKPRT